MARGRGRVLPVVGPVLAAVTAVLLAGCGDAPADAGPVANVRVHDGDGLHGIVLPRPYRTSDVTLRDISGRPASLAGLARRHDLTLVFFGYTNCPDICQVIMANIASGLVRLDPARRSRVGVVFVTTDPVRDTPQALRTYLSRFDPGFTGLTGRLGPIVRAATPFGIAIEKGERLATGGYDVSHGTQVVGVRRDGTAPYVWTQGTTPPELADDLTTLLDDDKVPTP